MGIYPVATFSDHRNVPEVFKRFGRGNMPRPAPDILMCTIIGGAP
jgi:hypothetical protein